MTPLWHAAQLLDLEDHSTSPAPTSWRAALDGSTRATPAHRIRSRGAGIVSISAGVGSGRIPAVCTSSRYAKHWLALISAGRARLRRMRTVRRARGAGERISPVNSTGEGSTGAGEPRWDKRMRRGASLARVWETHVFLGRPAPYRKNIKHRDAKNETPARNASAPF